MKEKDIRDREKLKQYLELLQKDCRDFFKNEGSVSEVNCTACKNTLYNFEFNKSGFNYVTCLSCGTLYARDRLSFESMKKFYTQSVATDYWIREFFQPFVEARREKIFKPRAEFFVKHFGEDKEWKIGDIGAGFGLFLSELKKLWPSSSYIAIEPSLEQARICERLNIKVECSVLEELKGYGEYFDILTAFELLEHLYDPFLFLSAANRHLKQGGWLLMTTLNGEGFDIQVLWGDSKAIFPPCHINFFNPDSLSKLLDRAGFRVEQIETPGQLDWDIVEKSITCDDVNTNRFWRTVAQKGTPEIKGELQDWIAKSRFSSHVRVLARKK